MKLLEMLGDPQHQSERVYPEQFRHRQTVCVRGFAMPVRVTSLVTNIGKRAGFRLCVPLPGSRISDRRIQRNSIKGRHIHAAFFNCLPEAT